MTIEVALARLEQGDPIGALDQLPSDVTNPSHHAIRGMVLLANHQPEPARLALRAAVALGDTEPATRLNLALAEQCVGDREQARRWMRILIEQLPTWDEPRLRLAESLRDAGQFTEAEAAYADVLEINPHREEALVALAGLQLARGDSDSAKLLLLRCCGIAPRRAEAWDTLGLAFKQAGDTALAASAFAEAHHLAPYTLEYALHRVEAATSVEAQDALLAAFEVESSADPLNPALHTARGALLERLGQRAAAIDALETGAVLAPKAKIPAAYLAGVLARSNRLQQADLALRRAMELDPDNPRLINDHAAVLMRMHRHAEARQALLGLIDDHGEQANILCNLANATVCLGLHDDAVALARRAIDRAPDAVLPWRTLGNTLPYCDGVTGTELLSVLRACSDRLPRTAAPAWRNSPDPDRPLVVGLLSGTLKTHPVGWLTIAGFETLDPDQFSIVCLAQNAAEDPIARRFRAVAQSWHDVDALSDPALAAQARTLGIDLLIDLGGYGDAARMAACAHRLAPVQLKWVGMQTHSTGLAEMDWIITDRWETPPDLEHCYSERPLRLRDGYVCYSPPPYAPDVVALPALRDGHVTFGCFNNLAKITPRTLATWCEIMHRLPSSRLVLKTHQFSDPGTADRIRANFVGQGIAPERIDLRGSSPHRAFLNEYNQIDIVLDPFPYSGGLTTCEALWMGVPTITLPGQTFSSRHSMSHMSNAGLADWVAKDHADYVAMAVVRASDIASLAALRCQLRAHVKASPLCDAPRFGRSLAVALRHAWRTWCQETSGAA